MPAYPGHETISALSNGKIVDLEGLLFVKDNGEISPGDTYIGARNTVDIYVCERLKNGLVYPEGNGYPFDVPECVKVRIVEGDATADYTVPQNCRPYVLTKLSR